MPTTTEVSAKQKSAYQRPYKTRSERREIARRKYDENADRKFLYRLALAFGIALLIVGAVLLKTPNEPAAPVSALAGATR